MMKEMDCIEVTAEKKAYTDAGVHKGMVGWICHRACVEGCWLVNFPQYGAQEDVTTVGIHRDDMRVIPTMNAHINEHFGTQHEKK